MCEHCSSPLRYAGQWLDIFGYMTCSKHVVPFAGHSVNGFHEIRLERRSLERWLTL